MKKLLLSLTMLMSFSLFANSSPRVVTLNESNTITMSTDFNQMSVARLQQDLFNKVLVKNPPKEIYLVLNSPGGSVSAGKLFIDTANALDVKINTITIFSASMGYNTVQGIKNGSRMILPSGTLMSHRAYAGGLQGQFPGELDARVKMLHASTRALDEVAASRVGISYEEYSKLIQTEYWVSGAEAVKANHADEVVLAKCSEELMTTREESIYYFGVEIVLTMSNCPVITGFVDYRVNNVFNTSPELIDRAVNEMKKSFNMISRIETRL